MEKMVVDGIGDMGKSLHAFDAQKEYKAELHVATPNMQKGNYTAHVELTLTMEDGGEQQITDTFVFLY